MKVALLRQALSGLPDDVEVVISVEATHRSGDKVTEWRDVYGVHTNKYGDGLVTIIHPGNDHYVPPITP